MLWNYAYLNPGLTLYLNGEKFYSENGLKDLLQDNLDGNTIHDIIHLKGDDIEVALTHSERMQGEQFYSFVNGQHTTQGGTHQMPSEKRWWRLCVIFTVRILTLLTLEVAL